jgi:CDP-4-dehydro-6-deoxyglucose reductase
MSIPAVLLSKDRVTASLFRLTFRLPSDWTFGPGQFVIIPVPPRPEDAKPPKGFYSVASGQGLLPKIELLVEHREGGGYVSAWVTGLEPGATVQMEGPLGHFGPVKPAEEPQVFLCHRAGLAPLRAMLLSSLGLGQEHWLFLGGRDASEWLLHEEWQALARAEPRFHYCPLADAGAGSLGLAEAALKALPDRRGRLYLAGFTRDVAPLAEALVAGGFGADALRVEKFG